MMDIPNGLFLAWSIIVVTSHWIRTKSDVALLFRQVQSYIGEVAQRILNSNLEPSKRVDEAMNRMRVENYVLTCRLLQHAALSGLITIPLTYGQDLTTCVGMLLCGIVSYGMHTSLANGSLRLSAGGIRCLFSAYYVMLAAFIWHSPQTRGTTSTANQKTLLTAQFAAVVCFVDSRVHVPGQLMMFLAETGRYFTLNNWDSAALEFVAAQFVTSMLIIAASVVHEHTLRERLSAQFRHVDAESMISSFRTLLRGVCDAEILLDEQLRIHDAGAGLDRLLSTSGNWEGRDFEDILVQDANEKTRFHSFISTETHLGPGAPPCLRVSLQPHGRLGVDLFHAAVPHLHGCEGAYHLLAMKLDAECFMEPEARESPAILPMPEIRRLRSHQPHHRSSRASRSACSDCSMGSLLQSSPNLKEMMLLVDAKDQHEVLQVHLSYMDRKHNKRRSSDDSPKSSRQAVPTLRALVRPTDWGTVCRQVEKYTARRDPGAEKSLGQVWVRMFDRPSTYMLARQARLKPLTGVAGHCEQDSNQLWLHLKDFRHERPEQRSPSELEDIGEACAAESEPDLP